MSTASDRRYPAWKYTATPPDNKCRTVDGPDNVAIGGTQRGGALSVWGFPCGGGRLGDPKALVDFRVALEVLGDGLARDVRDGEFRERVRIEPEAAEVGREDQCPAGREQRRRIADKRHVVALHIERLLHALRAREGRRIEKDQPVAPATVLPEPFEHVGLDQLVVLPAQAGKFQIAPRPV